jgi:hypothetical protein
VPRHDDVQLLARVRLGLVVLADEPVAIGSRRHRVDAERSDPEVMSHRPKPDAPVVDRVDLVEPSHRVFRHVSSSQSTRWSRSYLPLDCSSPGDMPHAM